MKITVGLDSLRNYQRMPYELHYALGELVDNAIQAYIDEKKNLKKRLDKEGKKLEIHIHYEPNLDLLRVTDNSTGITKERLSEAFEIGKKIERSNAGSSMGQFNVGMKASAIWLADEWRIRTKRWDEEKELEMIIINEEVFSGNNEITEQYSEVGDVTKHHTVLEFSKLRKKETVDYQSYGPLKEAIENYLIMSVKDISRIVTKSKSRDDDQKKKYNEMVKTLIDDYDYNEHSAEEIITYASNNLWRDS